MNKLYISKYCIANEPKISEEAKVEIVNNIEPVFKDLHYDSFIYDIEVILERHETGEMRLSQKDYDLLCEIIKEADFIEF